MTVTDQEIVAHLFAPLDGPSADRADTLIREIWTRCREQLGMTALVPRIGLDTRLPAEIAKDRRGRSALVAACTDQEQLYQAILRREHDVLNLSILLKEPERLWSASTNNCTQPWATTSPR